MKKKITLPENFLVEVVKYQPDFTKSLPEFSECLETMGEDFFSQTDLLTKDSHKITVSNLTMGGKYRSAILYMLQGNLSGYEVCPFRTKSCSDGCLGTNSGHACLVKEGNQTNHVQLARMVRTVMYFNHRELFKKKLFKELTKFVEECKAEKVKPAFRFNGTSDLSFVSLKIPNSDVSFCDHFSNVMFYDYTKSFNRTKRFLAGKFPKNYHVTYSFTPENKVEAGEALKLGANVAVAFATKKADDFVGKYLMGAKIVLGDSHDLRFKDPQGGYVIGLTAKGHGYKKDTSGFFVDTMHTGTLTKVQTIVERLSFYGRKVKRVFDKINASNYVATKEPLFCTGEVI